jgi:hypothetical protein
MPPIATGDLITAVQFNELVTSYNKLWGDNVTSAIFADITTNFATHSHGWGQANAEPTVAITDIILAEHTNRLLSQMNAGLYHYDDASALIAHFGNTRMYASIITDIIEDKITDMSLETNRFNANSVDSDVQAVVISDIDTPTWTTTISSVGKASFATYDEARYFFNSGGKISINLDQDSASGDASSWDGIFVTTGEIRIGAIDTVNSGWNPYTILGGFYAINPTGVYTDVFAVTGYVESGEYAYGQYSAYSNRSITVSLKAEEVTVGGEFNVYVKVTLIDDITSGTISSELTCDYGYVNQNTTPTQAYIDAGSNGVSFTAGTHIYQFNIRQIPTLTVDTSWTI